MARIFRCGLSASGGGIGTSSAHRPDWQGTELRCRKRNHREKYLSSAILASKIAGTINYKSELCVFSAGGLPLGGHQNQRKENLTHDYARRDENFTIESAKL